MIAVLSARRGLRPIPQIRTGDTIHPEAARWAERVSANSGTLGAASLAIASRFMWEVENRTWKNKLLWVAPMLGSNLAAARTPLRDWLGGGLMANTGFLDADFAETTGLQGDGSSKILNTNIYPAQLGRGLAGGVNGGLGYWELAVDQSGTTTNVMGCFNAASTERFSLDIRNTTTNEFFFWGGAGNGPTTGVNATSIHYYGQRESATLRTLFKSGVSAATNTTSDAPTGAGETQIRLVGVASPAIGYNKGRCGLAYMTSGDLTAAEVLDLHGCLSTYLKTASGK